MPKILVADDDASIRTLLSDLLKGEGYDVSEAKSGAEVLAAVGRPDRPDLILMDVRMPEMTGMEVLRRLRDNKAGVGVLVMTAYGTSNLAIQSIQLGAYDYITKPFDLDEVLHAVRRYFEHHTLQGEVQSLRRQLGARDPAEKMVGRSPVMLEVYKTVGRVAGSDATVLITGETGTGKELVAEIIHQNSPYRQGQLVKVACATLPETLLESELFGHEKGSFTSAYQQRKGRFELADKGSIFLDEMGEMSLSTQKKLLRVLQEREFERVGGTQTIHVDCRVIAATNKNLAEEVAKGTFREDLYYRLNVIAIHMPPLRQREGDIPLLVEHFLDKYRFTPQHPPAKISEEALEMLEAHDWPGNVRELENTIERAVILARGGVITREHLRLVNRIEPRGGRLSVDLGQLLDEKRGIDDMLAEVERRLLAEAMHRSSNQIEAAAALLGLTPAALEKRLRLREVPTAEPAAAT
ncbi:MAG TPA: sigma-54 dependent transcriptional regulator [Chloroflexota bacterium]|nr:sigma-54 dependent transcriptional regulator [Chloroflexota bacterium]